MNKDEKLKNTVYFLMPGIDLIPVGGYKVIYEMANRLVDDDFNVILLLPCFLSTEKKTSLKRKIGKLYYYIKSVLKQAPCSWFTLDPRIKRIYVFNDSKIRLQDNTFVCATAIETAFVIDRIHNNVKKFYYIQDFEAWSFTENEVFDSYKLPLKKIVIASWLAEKVITGAKVYDITLIPNGFDFSYFMLYNSIEERNCHVVSMLYHTAEHKRCTDALGALYLVKEQIPELQVNIFGTADRPNNLPSWFTYYRKPDKITHNKIYNESALYVAASSTDGFALTIGEAMICGNAVACTNIGGFTEMVIHNKTGLLSPVYDSKALAANIIRLIKDNNLRIAIAKAGHEHIKKYTWESSYKIFKSLLLEDNTNK
jgi:glycosyltransferase involved in cell wall biosynthesis